MKKILLVCDMGMSTSLVVKKMQDVAARRQLEIDIQAKGMQEFKEAIQSFDCALLGPQISYKLAACKEQAAQYGKKSRVYQYDALRDAGWGKDPRPCVDADLRSNHGARRTGHDPDCQCR
ncbi:PTS sugar transporter subunit IIB [Aeromonas veronii]|uniref:PTS sugar transporter subunit IIB n=1 Tax=Aeromonas veronii TaxID=654 RepID=UPI002443CDB2|nr:PTS sugar transporter subunit IIB [Aeromonas veronii]